MQPPTSAGCKSLRLFGGKYMNRCFGYRSDARLSPVIFALMSGLTEHTRGWKRTRSTGDPRGMLRQALPRPDELGFNRECVQTPRPRLGEKWRDVEEDQGSWSIAEHARSFACRDARRLVHNAQFAGIKSKRDKLLIKY